MSDEKKSIWPMTDVQIAAIRERCDKATPPPWENKLHVAKTADGIEFDRSYSVIAGDGGVCMLYKGDRYNGYHNHEADAAFIANARQAVPDLLAEVARLRDENEALKNNAFEFGVMFSTKVNEMRAREEWLIGHLAEGDAYEWRCPNVKDEPWPWATCDSCNAGSVESRKRCWRKAAEMATREKQGESGEVPENPGGIRPCPECGSPAEMDNSPWDKKTPFFVVCTNKRCLACGPNAESKEKAIEAWNNQ